VKRESYLWPCLPLSAILLLVAGKALAGRIIYVDRRAPGENTGTSWDSAYRYLQDALADANAAEKPVEIRIAKGTYKPDQGKNQTSGDREATFRLINGVTLKGGYAGESVPDPDLRDIELYETVLSGDLNGNDAPVNDPWDMLDELTHGENSYHVVTGSGTNKTAILHGFTITAGNADGLGYEDLGKGEGGGMYNYSGSPTLTNCTFTGNRTRYAGGAMANILMSSPTLASCALVGNSAQDGGGMWNFIESSPLITNCTLRSNHSNSRGGGIYNQAESSPILTNCKIIGNTAGVEMVSYGSGGGIYNRDGCNPTLINCIIAGNLSRGHNGGGMHNWNTDRPSSPTLINCTFAGNSAPMGHALACDSLNKSAPTTLRIINSILWDEGNEMWNNDNSVIAITYSDVQGLMGSRFGLGQGNISKDPCFANPGYYDTNKMWVDGDYHLKSQPGRWDPESQTWVKDDVTSPCIDAGDPMSPIGDEPFPNAGIINMGAYGGTVEASKSYFGEPVCQTIVAGDIDGDCKVNFADFAIMALHWLEDNKP